MTYGTSSQGYGSNQDSSSALAMGVFLFAAAFMIIDGVFHVIQGLAALLDDGYLAEAANYAYDIDITSWGWIHIVTGVVVGLAGVGLLTGSIFARMIALFIIVASTIVNFVYIPYAPVWSIVQIVVAGAATWAILSTPDFRDDSKT